MKIFRFLSLKTGVFSRRILFIHNNHVLSLLFREASFKDRSSLVCCALPEIEVFDVVTVFEIDGR